MAYEVGSSPDSERTDSGRSESGTISPPISIEGRKMSCDQSTVEREPVAITPIRAPMEPKVNAVSRVIQTKLGQELGTAALKSGPPARAIRVETIRAWKMVLRAGIDRIESAGTPLILKLRKMPASRASTSGPGRPSRV